MLEGKNCLYRKANIGGSGSGGFVGTGHGGDVLVCVGTISVCGGYHGNVRGGGGDRGHDGAGALGGGRGTGGV